MLFNRTHYYQMKLIYIYLFIEKMEFKMLKNYLFIWQYLSEEYFLEAVREN